MLSAPPAPSLQSSQSTLKPVFPVNPDSSPIRPVSMATGPSGSQSGGGIWQQLIQQNQNQPETTTEDSAGSGSAGGEGWSGPSLTEPAPCLAESSCWRFWRFWPGPASSLHSYRLMIAGPVRVGGSAANGPGPEVLGGSGRFWEVDLWSMILAVPGYWITD